MNTLKVIIITLIIFTGCLEEPPVNQLDFEISNSTELLIYLERKGDYINSPAVPSLIEASEVYNNLNTYLIIDLRDSLAFKAGRISTAINLKPADLLNYFKNINTNQYPKIVFVSETGQSAAYYSALFRLYGIYNIFSMNFGMASWNINFSSLWLNILNNPGYIATFKAEFYPKLPYSDLPEVNLSSSDLTEQEKLEERINILVQEGFGDHLNSAASSLFEDIVSSPESNFIICYGPEELYYSKLYGVLHPAGAVHFYPPPVFSDFRSTRYLQTLPNNKPIAIYSIDGQLGAHTTAYLRVLGYNVKSILFGGHGLLGFIGVPTLLPFTFSPDRIENFPYITGS
jgi:rhodanese-related sulfurtransferase